MLLTKSIAIDFVNREFNLTYGDMSDCESDVRGYVRDMSDRESGVRGYARDMSDRESDRQIANLSVRSRI